MSWPRIVCPPNRSLLRSFTERTVAVRVAHPHQAAQAAARVWESGNHLFCVIIDSSFSLDKIELGEDLKHVPLAVMAPSWGKFRHLARRLERLRDFNLRIYLPGDVLENLAGLRILSSLGIHTCAVLGNGRMDWDALTDLMTYAVLELAPHASMEPFSFIASRHDPFSYLEWGALYFDDPKSFLHLDAKGRVALSAAELRNKQFIASSLKEIGEPAEFPAIRDRLQSWRQFFVDNHPCASCGGWKICLGRFAVALPENQGCAGFFLELMDVARQYQARKVQAEELRIWQP
ncbi:MAG: hypothetical protein FJ134_11800 [Deltaproteobacteria bacterium]|nr:hypothetical protein [Deltaproteobacteria bacterium]